jgi:hypothetical protein
VLAKPCDPARLLEVIRRVLQKSQRLRERSAEIRQRVEAIQERSVAACESSAAQQARQHMLATDKIRKSGEITDRIRGEFREMPGLSLTLAQAARLWNVDQRTCQAVLDVLVSEKFLACRSGRYSM